MDGLIADFRYGITLEVMVTPWLSEGISPAVFSGMRSIPGPAVKMLPTLWIHHHA